MRETCICIRNTPDLDNGTEGKESPVGVWNFRSIRGGNVRYAEEVLKSARYRDFFEFVQTFGAGDMIIRGDGGVFATDAYIAQVESHVGRYVYYRDNLGKKCKVAYTSVIEAPPKPSTAWLKKNNKSIDGIRPPVEVQPGVYEMYMNYTGTRAQTKAPTTCTARWILKEREPSLVKCPVHIIGIKYYFDLPDELYEKLMDTLDFADTQRRYMTHISISDLKRAMKRTPISEAFSIIGFDRVILADGSETRQPSWSLKNPPTIVQFLV